MLQSETLNPKIAPPPKKKKKTNPEFIDLDAYETR